MKPSRFKNFVAEDYKGAPQWFLDFLTPLSEALGDTVTALTNRLSRTDNMLSVTEPLTFTTKTTATDTFPLRIKNKLAGGTKPRDAWISMFSRKDGGVPTGAWSPTIRVNDKGEIEVSFQGLENSTDYVCNLVYEG